MNSNNKDLSIGYILAILIILALKKTEQ